ncbi:MAG: hypothetical protein AAFV25_03555 [Bacteroidota bacterium]
MKRLKKSLAQLALSAAEQKAIKGGQSVIGGAILSTAAAVEDSR